MSTLTRSSVAFASVGIEAPNAHDTEAASYPYRTAYDFKPDTAIEHTAINKSHLFALGALAALLHGAAVIAYLNYPATPAEPKPKVNKVEIEFIKAKPPEVIEPPKPPPPPPPKVVKPVTPQAAKPAPALRTAVAQDNVPAEAITIPENRQAPVTAAPVVAAPPVPEAPAVKAEEPITEATGNAAYLNNPPPDYPAFAQRQSWEGKVLLRVHVLANGKPDKVEIKQSSGRKTLDESATNAVRNWTFIPSKRGSSAIDGWATVPIEFKLAK